MERSTLFQNKGGAQYKGSNTLATLFNHMWPRIVAGIFIPVGNHYFQALASTLQFVAQVCDYSPKHSHKNTSQNIGTNSRGGCRELTANTYHSYTLPEKKQYGSGLNSISFWIDIFVFVLSISI